MKKEALQLDLELQNLKNLYIQSNCTTCDVMHHYFKREYYQAQAQLKSLEQQSFIREDVKGISINALQQSTALLGLYIMV